MSFARAQAEYDARLQDPVYAPDPPPDPCEQFGRSLKRSSSSAEGDPLDSRVFEIGGLRWDEREGVYLWEWSIGGIVNEADLADCLERAVAALRKEKQ